MGVLRNIIFCFFFLLLSHQCLAQFSFTYNLVLKPKSNFDSTLYLHINNITVKGNKKTKDYIILREAQLIKGDSIITAELYTTIEQARLNVYNTTLFNEVKINTIAVDAFTIDIEIEVKERWYVFPTPQFKLVDRSLNEWIKVYNADLQRVIYGVKFAHYNISGRRDQLRFYLLNGYNRGLALSYTAPYSNKALTQGFSVGFSFSQGREINYETYDSNRLAFFSTKENNSSINSFVSKTFNINASFRLRKGVFNTHIFGAGFTYSKVSDSIHLKYNPNYFGTAQSSIGFPEFSYNYIHTNVNNVAYPLKGNSGFFGVLKRGLGFSGKLNMLAFDGGYNKFINLGNNWYFSNGVAGSIKLPFKQAYVNQRGLGYGASYLRGLELYAIDGVAYVLNKATLKKKIVSFKITLPFGIPFIFKKKEKIPFTFFAKTYTDIGYSYNKYNSSNLNNKLLYTGGFGIDMLTFYDFTVRFEYSFNQLNENGLFLRLQSGF
jgi:outer membrane protein assembly factor BamA